MQKKEMPPVECCMCTDACVACQHANMLAKEKRGY